MWGPHSTHAHSMVSTAPLTSTVKSSLFIPVLSSWLPGYINVMQTILIILTMAGLFPNRPCFLISVILRLTSIHFCNVKNLEKIDWMQKGQLRVTMEINFLMIKHLLCGRNNQKLLFLEKNSSNTFNMQISITTKKNIRNQNKNKIALWIHCMRLFFLLILFPFFPSTYLSKRKTVILKIKYI